MVIIQTYLRVKLHTSTGKSHIPALNERNRIKSLVIFSYFCLTYFYDLPVIDMESMKGYLSKHVSLSSHSNALKKELLSSSRAIACRGVACSVFNDEMPAARRFDFQLTDKWKAPAFCDKLNSFPPSSICTAVCAMTMTCENLILSGSDKKLQSSALINNIAGMTHQRFFIFANVFPNMKWAWWLITSPH